MKKIISVSGLVLNDGNLSRALSVLTGRTFILYTSKNLSEVAEILVAERLRERNAFSKRCLFPRIRIFPEVDEKLKLSEWYLFNKDEKYFSHGDCCIHSK